MKAKTLGGWIAAASLLAAIGWALPLAYDESGPLQGYSYHHPDVTLPGPLVPIVAVPCAFLAMVALSRSPSRAFWIATGAVAVATGFLSVWQGLIAGFWLSDVFTLGPGVYVLAVAGFASLACGAILLLRLPGSPEPNDAGDQPPAAGGS